jgi:hypothetical protein
MEGEEPQPNTPPEEGVEILGLKMFILRDRFPFRRTKLIEKPER